MGAFICEKCGKLDNTACNNNYWHAAGNKYRVSIGEEISKSFKSEFEYFETHACCSDCCEGVTYKDNSGTLKKGRIDIKNKCHWKDIGKEKLLKDKNILNAQEYFRMAGDE